MTRVQWSDEYKAIVQLLGVRAGLSFRSSGRETVELAIRQTMRLAGYSSTEDYYRFLNADADALDDLLVQTTVGETYFFRHFAQFQLISQRVIPAIDRLRTPGHTLRFWSAGCASGEEAYSLAMLLHRHGALSRATVLGTDISRASLKRARQAIYRDWSLRGNGMDWARPYLTAIDGHHHVNEVIKQSVRFEYLNLALDNYPSIASGTRGMDLILCRNVLIYFDRQTIRSVLDRLARSLAEGGWLITAASDPPIEDHDQLEPVQTDHGLVYRKKCISSGKTFAAASDPLSERMEQKSYQESAPPEGSQTSDEAKLAVANQALLDGDYERAATLTTGLLHVEQGAIIHVKSLASTDVMRAEKACIAETKKWPLSIELHYLYAVLLIDLNRLDEAAETLRRVLYLDGSLALIHFTLGAVLRTLGDLRGSRRAFRNALQICDASPADQMVPLGDDETVGELRDMAQLQLDVIEKSLGARV